MPAATSPAPDRVLAGAAAVAALLAIAFVAVLVALRIGYPFELEWMEGAMVDHAERVRQGLPIYCVPGPEHVSFLYTPLLFQLGALVSFVTGMGYLALRLVSLLAAVGCAVLLYRWAAREAGRRLAGLLAAGLFCAGYGYLRTWYDLARNDTLFLCFTIAAAYLLRFHGRRSALAAGLLVAIAFLAKQSALMWLPAILTGALLLDWRKGLWFAASAALSLGVTVLLGHLLTDGWFTFFVFEMPGKHAIQGDRKLAFFTEDLVPILPMVLGALLTGILRMRNGRRGEGLFLLAFGGGGLVTSYLSRLHAGGYDNVMMYALAAGAMLLPALLGAGARATRTCLVLVLTQFLLLTVDVRALWQLRPMLLLDPHAALPTAAHRQATEELLAFLRSQPGPVLVPSHGWIGPMAGKEPAAHGQAIFDLLQGLPDNDLTALLDPARMARLSPRYRTALTAFFTSYLDSLKQRRWSAIVLAKQDIDTFEYLFVVGLEGYRRRPEPILSRPEALQPVVGRAVHSPQVLERRP